MTRNEDELENEDDSTASQAHRLALAPKMTRKISNWVIIVVAAGSVGVIGVFGCCFLITLLIPSVEISRSEARAMQSGLNLKQVGLASFNFYVTHEHFPPLLQQEVGGIQNQPHSWVTAILPFLDHEPLYKMVQFNEPWDAPTNQTVFSNTLTVLINPGVEPRQLSSGYGPAHYAWNSQIMAQEGTGQGFDMLGITDGASNTMLAGTVAVGIKPWADPSNVRNPAEGIGAGPRQFNPPSSKVVQVLLADGGVQTISADIDPAVFRALGPPAGGESIPRLWPN